MFNVPTKDIPIFLCPIYKEDVYGVFLMFNIARKVLLKVMPIFNIHKIILITVLDISGNVIPIFQYLIFEE